MLKNGVRYRVPDGVHVRMCRPLEEIGVSEAIHFGTFAAGEQFYAIDKSGREVSFLVDEGVSAWIPVLNLNRTHSEMWDELARLWEYDKDTTAKRFVEIAAARFVSVEEALGLCLDRARENARKGGSV